MFIRKLDGRKQTDSGAGETTQPRRLDISDAQSRSPAVARPNDPQRAAPNRGQPGEGNSGFEASTRNQSLPFVDRMRSQRPVLIDGTGNRMAEETIISSDLTIIGNVVSKGRVRLEGSIEGDMNCARLTVSETGQITGSIIAEEVAVHGRVAGTVYGRSVQLYATAHVEGDIHHQGIGIEMGTHYDGRLKWSDKVPGAVNAKIFDDDTDEPLALERG